VGDKGKENKVKCSKNMLKILLIKGLELEEALSLPFLFFSLS
jgi:hypothetical protein